MLASARHLLVRKRWLLLLCLTLFSPLWCCYLKVNNFVSHALGSTPGCQVLPYFFASRRHPSKTVRPSGINVGPSSWNRRTLQVCTIWFISFHFILFYFYFFIYFYWCRSSNSHAVFLLFKLRRFFQVTARLWTFRLHRKLHKCNECAKMYVSEWTLIGLLKRTSPKDTTIQNNACVTKSVGLSTRTAEALKCRQTNNSHCWHVLFKMKRLTRWLKIQSSSW